MKIENIIGDTAYSEKGNIDYAKENEIKLSKTTTHGNRKNEDKFEFNKDAGMYVCKSGHMSIRRARQGKKIREVIKLKHIILILINVRFVL